MEQNVEIPWRYLEFMVYTTYIFQVIGALWVYHINPAEIKDITTKRRGRSNLEMGDGINENKC